MKRALGSVKHDNTFPVFFLSVHIYCIIDFLQFLILETRLGIENLAPLFLDMEVFRSELRVFFIGEIILEEFIPLNSFR